MLLLKSLVFADGRGDEFLVVNLTITICVDLLEEVVHVLTLRHETAEHGAKAFDKLIVA